jgi:hypothetical protein
MSDWIKVTPDTMPPCCVSVQVACRKSIHKFWQQMVAYYDDHKEWRLSMSDDPIESDIDLYFVYYWRPLFNNPEK